jgi:hypothetical protein
MLDQKVEKMADFTRILVPNLVPNFEVWYLNGAPTRDTPHFVLSYYISLDNN